MTNKKVKKNKNQCDIYNNDITKELDKSLDSNEYHTYKNAEWLMNNYSISYFPSIPSFKYLRENKKEKVTTTDMNTFIGFGNPSIGNAFAISKEPEIKKPIAPILGTVVK